MSNTLKYRHNITFTYIHLFLIIVWLINNSKKVVVCLCAFVISMTDAVFPISSCIQLHLLNCSLSCTLVTNPDTRENKGGRQPHRGTIGFPYSTAVGLAWGLHGTGDVFWMVAWLPVETQEKHGDGNEEWVTQRTQQSRCSLDYL